MLIHQEHHRFAIKVFLEDHTSQFYLTVAIFNEVTTNFLWGLDLLFDSSVLDRKFSRDSLEEFDVEEDRLDGVFACSKIYLLEHHVIDDFVAKAMYQFDRDP